MTARLIIMADSFVRGDLMRPLGPNAVPLLTSFLRDMVDLAQAIPGIRLSVGYATATPPELDQRVALRPMAGFGVDALASLLADALGEASAVLIVGGDLPHLPRSRLRDALTHLAAGAAVVVGPADRTGWYLLGLATADPVLLRAVPARDVTPDALISVVRSRGHTVAVLPPWFGVADLADLAALADMLRELPPAYARHMRATLAAGTARAVGG